MADRFTATKDPDAVLDYRWDWTDYLGEDTITDVEFLTYTGTDDPDAVAVDSYDNDETSATAVLSGGVAGLKYRVTCRITTAGGITDDRSLYLTIKEM